MMSGVFGARPYGKSGLAKLSGETSTRRVTRSGCRAVKFETIRPPREWPTRLARATPSWSIRSVRILHFAGVGIVARGIGAGQAEARQVETDDPVRRRQGLSPRLPGFQTGAEAVQKDHRRGVARSGVTQAQADAVDNPVLAGIGRLQLRAGLVGRVKPNGQRDGRQRGQPANQDRIIGVLFPFGRMRKACQSNAFCSIANSALRLSRSR